VDWRRVKPGDRVTVPGGGTGVLESLPDRRGRVGVRVGGARLILPTEKVSGLPNDAPLRDSGRARHPAPAAGRPALALGGGTLHCDLRGLRVAEALDRVSEVLDRAAAEGCDGVELIHGHGTGALRAAVREHLASSPYVAELTPGDAEAGGDGVTLVRIGR
jgi:DNA mismatch repair protein MutS2